MSHQRISTTYSLPLDQKTVDLLSDAPLGAVEDVPAIKYVKLDQRGCRLLYIVPWDLDNEYVHKALTKQLRVWIKALQRVGEQA